MKTFVLAIVLVIPLTMHAQYQIDTVRHLNVLPGGGYSALWGYTAPDGREYAIIGCNGSSGRTPGTSIIDITDNANMRQVAFIQGPASIWREMKTYRSYAYVVSEGGGGVQIIDLSRLPDTASLVSSFNYVNGTKNTLKSHTITITDGFMYLNGCANWSPGGILIFDLRNNPTSPQFISEYQPEYIHDCYVLRDTIFAAAIYSGGGLNIADARNKANVQTIAKITYAGSGTHNAWVTKDRRFAITTDEIGNINPKQLHFWDISNLPSVPTVATSTFTVSPTVVVHNVTVRGDFAYSCWYSGRGAQVVDISNPALPVLAAGYAIPGSTDLDWGIYPYFPSGKIIMGDDTNGLWVFRFSGLAPRVPVTLLQPANGDTIQASSVTFRWTKSADLNRDPHYYEVHLRGAGLDTVWRANDSLSVFSDLSRLQAGQAYWWSIVTRDEWNTTASPDSFKLIKGIPTGVSASSFTPGLFRLEQNYPNPFNPSTTIRMHLPAPAHVILKVMNIVGQEVVTLTDDDLQAGDHDIRFDGTSIPSGVYFYRVTTSTGYTSAKRMVLLR